MDTFETVKAIVADVLKVDANKITLESRFVEDLKADSMDQFFLIEAFSDKFDVTISDDAASKIKTVADAVELLKK